MSYLFFLNELMPEGSIEGIDVQKEFEHTMMSFAQLRRESILDIDKMVILANEPSKISLCGTSLEKLVQNIGDRDLKTVCFSYLIRSDNSNLLDNNYQMDDIDDDELNEILDLTYHDGKSATNLGIACKNAWLLLSIPVEKEWRNSNISLDVNNKFKLINFYGDNKYDIIEKIFEFKKEEDKKYEEDANAYLVRFKYRLSTYQIECCESFEANFLNMENHENNHMIKRLYTAYSKNLISSCREETKLYRRCKGKNIYDMFELKSAHDLGIRFYVKKKGNTLIFGGIGKKSKYKGNQQNNDMKRAYDEIAKYENSRR